MGILDLRMEGGLMECVGLRLELLGLRRACAEELDMGQTTSNFNIPFRKRHLQN